jgi:hypothetical protein
MDKRDEVKEAESFVNDPRTSAVPSSSEQRALDESVVTLGNKVLLALGEGTSLGNKVALGEDDRKQPATSVAVPLTVSDNEWPALGQEVDETVEHLLATCVLEGIKEGNVDRVDRGNENWSQLHYASLLDSPQSVSVLLANGVDVDAIDTHGLTALMIASFQGFLPVVELLVEGGADIAKAERDAGKTAIDMAREHGHLAVVKYLEPAEIKWRRRAPFCMVRSSVKYEEPLTPIVKVLQSEDVSRDIASFL